MKILLIVLFCAIPVCAQLPTPGTRHQIASLATSQGNFFDSQSFDPCIVVNPSDSSQLIMFFTGMAAPIQTGAQTIGRATASVSSPTVWTVSNGGLPVLEQILAGWENGGDGLRADSCFYNSADSKIWLYYTAHQSHIGLARSSDLGLTWVRDAANPVLSPTAPETWNSQFAVIKEGASTFHGIYSYRTAGAVLPAYRYASSSDGISWTKAGADMYNDGTRYHEYHQLIKIGSLYVLLYESGGDAVDWDIRVATSLSPNTGWTRYSINPFLPKSGTVGAFDRYHTATPNLIHIAGAWWLFYCGATDLDQPYGTNHWQMGVAEIGAITWFARTDGSNTNCSGVVDAADPGSGALPRACAFADVPTAVAASQCGDTIKANAAHSWDTAGITLPDKGCSAAIPITITSNAVLPARRSAGAADAALTPRFRTTGGGVAAAAFIAASGADGWVLDGLEITDNAGTDHVNMLVDFSHGSNDGMTMTRCYLHQKETGVNYQRSAAIAMQFEGVGLTYTRNYVEDFIGTTYTDSAPMNTEALQCGGCKSVLMEDNRIEVWYNALFLGGGDTGAQHTATLTGASTTSATYSNVTGVAIGQFHRFSVVGTATLSNAGGTCPGGIPTGNCPTLTRATGDAWVSADGNHNSNWGDSMMVVSVADPTKFGITRLMTLTGDNVFTTMAASSSVANIPNGAVTYEIYQTARVTNIAGSVVTYDPTGTTFGDSSSYGVNSLNHVPVSVAWNSGDEGRVTDITVRKNTFYVNPVFAALMITQGRSCPKGSFEIKNVERFTYEGNYVLGYPAVLAFTAANQNGSAPWITNDHITIRNNWIQYDTGFPDCARSAIIIADDAYLNTITPTSEVTIENNLILRSRSFLEMKNGNVWTIKHNTVLNDESTIPGSNSLIVNQTGVVPAMNFRDNIVHYVCNGMNCPIPPNTLAACWPGGTFLNNVIVDYPTPCGRAIVNTSVWGAGSGLSPIIDLSAGGNASIGFTNLAGGVYSLDPSSNYKNDATDGTDPGVNLVTLLTALGAGGQSTSISGRVTVSGKVVIN